jgi:hypothetical protein
MTHSAHARRARLLAPVALLTLAGGCRAAAERVFTPPSAALRGVEVAGFGAGGAALAIANPNPYPLAASRASYRLLAADSTEVGTGSASEPVRVGARDSALVRLPLTVSWSALGRAGRGAARAGTAEYRIVGEVIADTPLGDRAIPIDARGRFTPIGARP